MPSFNDGLTEGLSIGTLLYLLVEWLCRQWKRKEEGDQNCSYQVQQSIAFIYTFSECSTAVQSVETEMLLLVAPVDVYYCGFPRPVVVNH